LEPNEDLREAVPALSAIGHFARVVPLTGSTNDDARVWASAGAPDGAVVIADAQSMGRGRQGRAWSSPAGASLAMSIVLRPAVPPARLPPLSIVVGLAVRRAIAMRVSRVVSVKWPNDVVVETDDERAPRFGKKIAGVLVEAAIAGVGVEHAIVGIGINVARDSFPDELSHRATSLSLLGCRSLSRTALAVDVIAALDDEVAHWLGAPSSLASRVAPHDALRGLRVRLEDGGIGIAEGLEHDGRLRVLCDDGVTIRAFAGEVVLESETR
jgi:BirA family biotin operon repressor/biotin-[acetyl-CoA-carboxylase] ligase